MSSLLRVRGLDVAYGAGDRQRNVVHGVDLDIAPGEFVAVVGESGSGKTTLAHAIIGLLPGSGAVTAGSVTLGDRELIGLGPRQMNGIRGARIGLVPQDPGRALNPVHRIGRQIAEPLLIHRRADRRAAAEQAVRMLEVVGIDDPATRARQYPHQLSGGMRQRVLIAMALICEPELLIADEPTSALDVTVQKRVLDHLDEAVERTGTAVLFITHDLAVAADRADRVVVMKDGRIVEQGAAGAVLHNPTHEYTQKLIAAAPSLSSARITAAARPAVAEDVTGEPDGRPPALAVHDLVKDFSLPGRRTLRAVDHVTFEVPTGRTFALVGESGSGKTTTARIAMNLERPTSGQVLLAGDDITGARGAALRRLRERMQIVYQNPYASLNPRWSIGRIIAEPLDAFGRGSAAERRDRVRQLLDRVALPADFAERRAAELSGGQLQRVAIVRALALDPEVVVLDEPVSALDVSVQSQILQLLVDLQAELGLTYLFITHDLAVVRQLADLVGVMRHGELVEQGPVADLFAGPRTDYTRELLAAIPGTSRRVTD